MFLPAIYLLTYKSLMKRYYMFVQDFRPEGETVSKQNDPNPDSQALVKISPRLLFYEYEWKLCMVAGSIDGIKNVSNTRRFVTDRTQLWKQPFQE